MKSLKNAKQKKNHWKFNHYTISISQLGYQHVDNVLCESFVICVSAFDVWQNARSTAATCTTALNSWTSIKNRCTRFTYLNNKNFENENGANDMNGNLLSFLFKAIKMSVNHSAARQTKTCRVLRKGNKIYLQY